MTEYVATRWYRAPEIMLSFTNYTKAIDIWSVGCILAELLGGKPIFRGKDYVDQLNQILLILGTPKESTLTKIGSVRAQNYVRSLPFMRKVHYSELFPTANPLALDLLEKMLTLDPYERITVEEALNHPYLSVWHDPQDEPECQIKFDFKSFETVDDMKSMKNLIIDEVKNFRDFVRKPLQEQQQIQLQMQIQQQEREKQKNDSMDLSTPINQQQFNEMLSSSSNSNSNSNSNPETGVNTDTPKMTNDNDLQYYQSIPKPQELDEFTFSHNSKGLSPTDNNDNHTDLFRLEEELGFGLDGAGMFNNI